MEIEYSKSFRKDLKRELAGIHKKILTNELDNIIKLLASNNPMPPIYKDHSLKGKWVGHRDIHIKPDLILIYRKTETSCILVRLGAHSILGLE